MPLQTKLILSAIVLSLLIWLAVSPVSKRNRIDAINAALAKYTLVDSTDDAMFRSFVKHVATIAGVDTRRIRINTPSQSHLDFDQKLNFVVSYPDIQKWTKCAHGNAVYDASLNTIFIDISLVTPSKWYAFQDGFQLGRTDLPFTKTYLQIVLLHELGHYVLHGKSAGYLSGDESKGSSSHRKREAEADQFAMTAFATYIEKYDDLPQIGNLIDISIKDLSKRDQSIAALIEMAFANTLGMMFGMSDYSPYYYDDAHPTYVDRTITLLNQILSLKNLDTKLRVNGIEILNYIEQIREIAKTQSFTEITFEERVQDIGFSDEYLFVTPARLDDKYGAFYQIKLSDLKISGRGIVSVQIDSNRVINTPEQIMDADQRSRIFTLSGKGTFYHERNAGFFEFKDRNLVRHNDWNSEVEADLHIPISPCNNFISIRKSELSSVSASGNIKKEKAQIQQAIRSKLARKDFRVSFDDPLINADKFAVTLTDTAGRIPIGIAIFDLEDLKLTEAKIFKVPDSLFEASFEKNKNAYLFNSKTGEMYVTTIELKNSIEVNWKLWKLREEDAPVLIGTYEFLAKKIVDLNGHPSNTPSMYRDRIINCGEDKFLMNWDNDCIFLIDISHETVKKVFCPGLETMRIRSNNQGDVVIFQPGGYRFYKIKT